MAKLKYGPCCGVVFLAVVNILFTIFGVALVGIGCLAVIGGTFMDGYLEPLLKSLPASPDMNVNLGIIFDNVAYICIGFGCFIFVVGILGCCGACCQIKTMLIVYTVIVILFVLAEIVTVAVLFSQKSKIENGLKASLRNNLQEYYAGEASEEPISKAWNFIFVEFDCCGVDNYTDLHNADLWNRKHQINVSTELLQIPETCCQVEGSFPNYKKAPDTECLISPNTGNSFYNRSCYDMLVLYVEKYAVIIISGSGAVLLIEILCIVFGIWVATEIKPRVRHSRYG